MAILTTTIEDSAPVLIYSGTGGGDWTAGTSRADTSIDEYSQSNYMVTNVANANVSFSFYGTGVQIYGAKRERHGQFLINIDGLTYPPQNGASVTPTFQTALFSTVALNEGYHTVTMTNLGSQLDIDFLTWQTPVGKTEEGLLAWTDQDTLPSFAYIPASAWSSSPTNGGMFSGGSGHVTQTAGAAVEYSFESLVLGDAVAIFGPVGPNGAPYSVQLGDKPPANYSANKQFYRPQNILFQASNLGGGTHKVRLVSQAWKNSTLQFAVDYAQVFTTSSLTSSDNGLSMGAIIGISLGVIAALLGLIFALFFFFRKKSPRFRKIFRPSKRMTDPVNTVPTSFEYRPISYDESSPLPPTTASSQQRLLPRHTHSNPSSSAEDQWPSTGGDASHVSTSPDLMLSLEQNGADTQLVTIPFTTNGKYRPDLQRAPQLMPPPQGANLHRTPSPSRDRDVTAAPRIQVREGYTQLPASSSAVGLMPSTAAGGSSSNSYGNWSNAASGAGSMTPNTFDVESTPRNQGLRPLPLAMPMRRAPSVPMSVSSQQSDLMSPPPQYQRNPLA
ncbi:hypothetical protein D9619_011705 [Psilocybe cf. subviscida]|uniref:Transmembrane protein n=1 Tax=Psilocybe cf. subviscida TaxID=2480587 RepID=A0A8H5BUP9_9AGAR|nr:hypothetical protein D9619_011705 [Psilocybe cf. subviscida]